MIREGANIPPCEICFNIQMASYSFRIYSAQLLEQTLIGINRSAKSPFSISYGSSNTNLPKITPLPDLVILNLFEECFPLGYVVLLVNQQRLHISYAPSNVSPRIGNLTPSHDEFFPLVRQKIVFDELELFRFDSPPFLSVHCVTGKLQGNIAACCPSREKNEKSSISS
jgi:hypothetical protein